MIKNSKKKYLVFSQVFLLIILLILISFKVVDIFDKSDDPFKGNEHFKMDSLDNPHSNMIIR